MTPELSRAAVQTMRQYDIASNGSNDTYGDFDRERVERMIGLVAEVFEARGEPMVEAVSVDDVVDGSFTEVSISLAPVPGDGAVTAPVGP